MSSTRVTILLSEINIEAFRTAEKKSKSIQLTMITSFGVRKNMYSGIVQNEVVLDDLFAPVM